MKIKILILTSILFLFSASKQILAQEATGEADTAQNLKERIERVVKEKEAEIQDTLEELSSKKKGFIGQVERVSNESVSIKTNKDTRIILIDETVELTKNNKNIKLSEIAVDDWVSVLGIENEEETFSPRFVEVSSQTLRPQNYKVALGTLDEVNKNELTFTSRKTQEQINLNLNKQSNYQDFEGQEITLSSLTADQQVLVIFYEDEDGDNQLKAIRILSLIQTEE